MGRVLGHTAASTGVSERTLRRYVNLGLLRGRKVGSQLELPADEERYLHDHHDLLSMLRSALRTERQVRLAVLFGSMATGEDTAESDVDLLVGSVAGWRSIPPLRRRLQATLGRRIHVVDLDAAREAPSLLADVLTEGRVVIDRDGLWAELRAEREAIVRRAEAEDAELMARAAAAVTAARQRLAA